MSSVAFMVLLASANLTCFPLPLVVSQSPVSVSAAPVGEAQHQWVSNANELVAELLDLARNGPEMEEPDRSKDADVIRAFASSIGGQRLANLRKADRILWRLWLTTGMAPVVRGQGKPLRIWLEENAPLTPSGGGEQDWGPTQRKSRCRE